MADATGAGSLIIFVDMAGIRTKIKIALVTAGLFLIAICLFVVWYSQQPMTFRMGSGIMAPTIATGEVVTAKMFGFFQPPSAQRWEVVVFPPDSTNALKEQDFEIWCMRVVGLPGETIHVREDGIYIDGKRQDQPHYLSHIRYAPTIAQLPSKITYPCKIPLGSYFLLGDNTSESLDSRYWGCLSGSRIFGIVKGK